VCRNARWEADHKELPVLVTPPRGRRPVKPWVTAFLDCYSRLIMGWALSLRPDSATVLAAMRRALVVDPERGPFGGVPRVLVPDGGLEFATTALARVCATLGTTFAPADAYAPYQPPFPGGSRIREKIRDRGCGAVACRGLGLVVVLRLPGLAVAGMMVRAARDAEPLWDKSPFISLALGPDPVGRFLLP
jgi:hypothetical protein